MKTLHIPLEDKEFKELEKQKGNMTWKDFILGMTERRTKKDD